eukprot:5939622-Pleurochrysis_carterae.AAC.1
MVPMSRSFALGRARRRIAAKLSRRNTSSSFTPRASSIDPSPAHACRASSAMWNDGSAASTPPPAAQCA